MCRSIDVPQSFVVALWPPSQLVLYFKSYFTHSSAKATFTQTKTPKIEENRNPKAQKSLFKNKIIALYPLCSRKKRFFWHHFRAFILHERGLKHLTTRRCINNKAFSFIIIIVWVRWGVLAR